MWTAKRKRDDGNHVYRIDPVARHKRRRSAADGHLVKIHDGMTQISEYRRSRAHCFKISPSRIVLEAFREKLHVQNNYREIGRLLNCLRIERENRVFI